MLKIGVSEEVGAFGGGEGVEDGGEPSPEGVDGAGRVLAQQRLQFAEGELDRVHVRRIGWQVEDLRTGSGQGLADCRDLVRRQVVEDDDDVIASTVRRAFRRKSRPSTSSRDKDAGWA